MRIGRRKSLITWQLVYVDFWILEAPDYWEVGKDRQRQMNAF